MPDIGLARAAEEWNQARIDGIDLSRVDHASSFGVCGDGNDSHQKASSRYPR